MGDVLLMKEDDGRYTSHLSSKGLKVVAITPLAFKFVNTSALNDALKNPQKYSGIIFTSPRTVEAVMDLYLKLSVEVHNDWKKKKIFAVGFSTSSTITSHMNLSVITGNASNSQQLASVIIKNTEAFDKPLLFPCGNLKRDELPKLLAQNDRDFTGLTCYETSPAQNLTHKISNYLSSNTPNFIVFFSPSGVTFSVPIMRQLGFTFCGTKIVAIGSTTNAELVKEKLPVFGIAHEPTPEGVAAVLK